MYLSPTEVDLFLFEFETGLFVFERNLDFEPPTSKISPVEFKSETGATFLSCKIRAD